MVWGARERKGPREGARADLRGMREAESVGGKAAGATRKALLSASTPARQRRRCASVPRKACART
eukprot:1762111-Rhodomonas_salina.1